VVIGRNQSITFGYFLFIFLRIEEALNALKSSLILTPAPIIFHVFTEDHLKEQFQEKVRN
jgi:hypothetical protein